MLFLTTQYFNLCEQRNCVKLVTFRNCISEIFHRLPLESAIMSVANAVTSLWCMRLGRILRLLRTSLAQCVRKIVVMTHEGICNPILSSWNWKLQSCSRSLSYGSWSKSGVFEANMYQHPKIRGLALQVMKIKLDSS